MRTRLLCLQEEGRGRSCTVHLKIRDGYFRIFYRSTSASQSRGCTGMRWVSGVRCRDDGHGRGSCERSSRMGVVLCTPDFVILSPEASQTEDLHAPLELWSPFPQWHGRLSWPPFGIHPAGHSPLRVCDRSRTPWCASVRTPTSTESLSIQVVSDPIQRSAAPQRGSRFFLTS